MLNITMVYSCSHALMWREISRANPRAYELRYFPVLSKMMCVLEKEKRWVVSGALQRNSSFSGEMLPFINLFLQAEMRSPVWLPGWTVDILAVPINYFGKRRPQHGDGSCQCCGAAALPRASLPALGRGRCAVLRGNECISRERRSEKQYCQHKGILKSVFQ